MRVNLNSPIHCNVCEINPQNHSKPNIPLRTSHLNFINKYQLSHNPRNYWVAFMGLPLNIIDGSNHATNMQHFMKALNPDAEIRMIDVKVSPNDKNIKLMHSLWEQLSKFNSKEHSQAEYVAIPALASISLLNLQDQYNALTGKNIKLTPQNIKAHKKDLINFFKTLYKNPQENRNLLQYMDSSNQGLEFIYPVIKEINKMIENGHRVFIPSGHPQDESLKWLADQRGVKDDLYHFIATGEDRYKTIRVLLNEIKGKNWYNFNLLSLSDARIVGVKDSQEVQDYMFAAYDACITDGARGVYNFSPVRKDNNLIGYSYMDTVTNQYPYEEFPANNEVANLLKFVGLPIQDLLATDEEILELKNIEENGGDTSQCADKLYPVKKIYNPGYIIAKKVDLKGDYRDKSGKLYFRTNDDGHVIFPRCDCEGSGRPSVLSMWGSCFAVFNVINNEMKLDEKRDEYFAEIDKSPDPAHMHSMNVSWITERADDLKKRGALKEAEDCYNHAISFNELVKYRKDLSENPRPYLGLAKLHFSQERFDSAEACCNKALNLFAKEFLKHPYSEYKNSYDSIKLHEEYLTKLKQYNKKIQEYNENYDVFDKLFIKPPEEPQEVKLDDHLYNYKMLKLMEIFDFLEQICYIKGEKYPADICYKASEELLKCTPKAYDIMIRRSEGINYIGDLFEEK